LLLDPSYFCKEKLLVLLLDFVAKHIGNSIPVLTENGANK
jgi:hypothetical protein